MEPAFAISESFGKLWKKRFSSYQKWSNCKEKELYKENWIEFEKLEEARKSKSFKYLENNLRTQTLSVPVSGGLTILDTVKPPSHNGIGLLQKREPYVIQFADQADMLLGSPESASQPTWLSKIEQEKMPYWFEAAINMKLSFVRVAAASVPPAGITFDCMSTVCCAECGDIHDPVIDEYYFWLIDSEYYGIVDQDANWDWVDPAILPTLLFMESEKNVYLAWTKIHNGKIGQLRWSSKAVAVGAADTPNLKFICRDEDFLLFDPIGVSTTPVPGFRYDIPTDTAVALPSLGELYTSSFDYYGLTSYPYFIYFSPGAPITPVSTYSTSLLVADNLVQHCNFEDALQWLEVELKPLISNNYWYQDWFDGMAEKQSVLLKYLTILSQWSKALLRIQTKEAINQSNLVVEFAKKILGNCPKTVFLHSNVDDVKTLGGFSPAKPPINPRLICLYNEIYDIDHRIQECINLFGLSSCENVDPCMGASVRCASPKLHCIDESIWCLPESPYRFQYLHSKALEYSNVLIGLGGALLSAYEKGDAEYLASLRETQSRQLLELSLEIRQNQYRAADFDVQALEKTLEMAIARLVNFQTLVSNGLIDEEEDYKTFIDQSMILQGISQGIEAVAGLFHAVPDPYVGMVNFVKMPGGEKTARFIQVGSIVAGIAAQIQSTRASKMLTLAGWERRLEEWLFQIELITIEIEQIIRQIRSSQRRRDVAHRELNNHALQMTHTQQTHDYLRDKFSNAELYHWLKKETSALYYQMYECTMQVAYQAQKTYNFECDLSNENFLDIPIWDHLHKSLLAGEKIQMALRRMEKSYMDKNFRQYELSKHISLRHHAPFEFLKLKESGKCMISLPESLFNQDYPSHYLRRIKSVTLTIPCIVGPYVGVHCKLTLISNKTRIKPVLVCGPDDCCEFIDSGYNEVPNDTRFRQRYGAKDAIATSTGQNESGMFELNFRDERYLHFEYEGVISKWCIELPLENNYFDLHSVADVIMQINYIAKEGGDILGRAAKSNCSHYLPGDGKKLFDLKSDFPNHWHEMKSKSDELEEKK
ncbi:MAG: insecticidal toxin complex protein, partial [Saprospiraceae bacterium]|nr:insecticidal toxin complex protein [Saprospiraceae bacterium]